MHQFRPLLRSSDSIRPSRLAAPRLATGCASRLATSCASRLATSCASRLATGCALVLATGCVLVLAAGCASAPDREQEARPSRRDPPVTLDGLELVQEGRAGKLYVKPGRSISSQHRYHLANVLLDYDVDSPHFSRKEEQRIEAYVKEQVIVGMIGSGATMMTGPAPCTLQMGVGIVDIELQEPDTGGASTNLLSGWGEMTLVVDLRDGDTGFPLLRYGKRISIPGGTQWHKSRPGWFRVRSTLDRLLDDQLSVFESVIRNEPASEASCQQLPKRPTPEKAAELAPAERLERSPTPRAPESSPRER